MYGAENLALRLVDQKYLASSEMRCCRRMEKTSCPDHVKNEQVLHRIKEERNILYTITRKVV